MSGFTSVMLQLSFSNQKLVPQGVWQRPNETLQDHQARKCVQTSSSELIARDTERTVDITSIRGKLELLGYTLTQASVQDRIGVKSFGSNYQTIRFQFMPAATAILQDIAYQHSVMAALDYITTMSFWRMRSYANPSSSGQWLSLNCEGRVQRFLQEDPSTPMLCKQRDAVGNKVGKPIPIRAHNTLEFINGMPTLVPYQI